MTEQTYKLLRVEEFLAGAKPTKHLATRDNIVYMEVTLPIMRGKEVAGTRLAKYRYRWGSWSWLFVDYNDLHKEVIDTSFIGEFPCNKYEVKMLGDLLEPTKDNYKFAKTDEEWMRLKEIEHTILDVIKHSKPDTVNVASSHGTGDYVMSGHDNGYDVVSVG